MNILVLNFLHEKIHYRSHFGSSRARLRSRFCHRQKRVAVWIMCLGLAYPWEIAGAPLLPEEIPEIPPYPCPCEPGINTDVVRIEECLALGLDPIYEWIVHPEKPFVWYGISFYRKKICLAFDDDGAGIVRSIPYRNFLLLLGRDPEVIENMDEYVLAYEDINALSRIVSPFTFRVSELLYAERCEE